MLGTRRAKTDANHKKGFKDLTCGCGNTVKVDANAGGVICPECVQRSVAPPDCFTPPKEKKEKVEKEVKEVSVCETGKTAGWPKCWWLKKEFVGPDGITYNKGKPVDNNTPST